MDDLNLINQKVNKFIDEHQAELAEFDLIIGVSRGGLIPATLVAAKIDKRLLVVYIDRQNNVYLDKPEWIEGKKVLLVDDICRTGFTLSLIKKLVESANPSLLKTFTLFCLSKSTFKPNYTTFIENDLKFPWDWPRID
ncbi:MAG: Phosphoribosyltransferase [Candidatus Nomurabacteria bacterium GW2011_GWB1_40_7]|uniref:Phosphoribosyltransferase n=1 Tax=Candidatus Nomurabacteria bacterium GW2011_GWB1_40_7 TaxID=1618744 RepID=A0A0G0W2W5_9BACT|nr:MAG: Phosphoribosyltransferase [Candidatus Nomurabacteria bacterium GW2011_GWB1_40_7]